MTTPAAIRKAGGRTRGGPRFVSRKCSFIIYNAASAGVPPLRAAVRRVMRTVARARGGEGPTWGCTMIPLLGDTFCVMQPQVSLTWGRTHTRAAPGDDICMYVCRACRAGSLACHGATRAWAELIAASDPLSVHGYREVNPCPVANRWPVASTHRSHLPHMSAVYHLTPPGDGEATPGDMAVQGAAPPGDTASLGAARGWPLPPPCAGYRIYYTVL